ncbi:hypothetical protein MUK42_26544, partial [Musa troglodytarum]
LNGYAVGDSLRGDPTLAAGEEQVVRHLGGAIAVLQGRVAVPAHDLRLDRPQRRPEALERCERFLVGGPLRRVSLAQVHLVRRVGRQDLYQRHPQNVLPLVGDGPQEYLVRVLLQFLALRRARLRHQAPAYGGPVREVPGVGVLPEVDGGVERRGDPDNDGA